MYLFLLVIYSLMSYIFIYIELKKAGLKIPIRFASAEFKINMYKGKGEVKKA